MSSRIAIVIALVMLGGDLPQTSPRLPQEHALPSATFSGETTPMFPLPMRADDASQTQQPVPPVNTKTVLKESSKLQLIRYVSGEFAKALKPLPGGKDGFIVYIDKPINDQYLERAVATHGSAINTGDNVQITSLEFHDKSIIVDLNGGGRPKKHWRDRIQVNMGGASPIPDTSTTQPANDGQDGGPPGFQPGQGGTLFLEFPQHVPDMSPDQLKELLAPFLDFHKVRSASVHWIDTLPPEMKKAITDRHAIPGMDREEVVAALGKPDRKVRERDTQGNDTEDWIYGHPPDKTIFVHFIGEHVATIKQYPQ